MCSQVGLVLVSVPLSSIVGCRSSSAGARKVRGAREGVAKSNPIQSWCQASPPSVSVSGCTFLFGVYSNIVLHFKLGSTSDKLARCQHNNVLRRSHTHAYTHTHTHTKWVPKQSFTVLTGFDVNNVRIICIGNNLEPHSKRFLKVTRRLWWRVDPCIFPIIGRLRV